MLPEGKQRRRQSRCRSFVCYFLNARRLRSRITTVEPMAGGSCPPPPKPAAARLMHTATYHPAPHCFSSPTSPPTPLNTTPGKNPGTISTTPIWHHSITPSPSRTARTTTVAARYRRTWINQSLNPPVATIKYRRWADVE